jgi:Do/DeqQ family serine protease
MNRLPKYQLWIIATIMLIVGAIAGASAMQAGRAPAAAVEAAAPPVREAAMMPTTFAPVVKSVIPAVVNISSSRMVRSTSLQGDPFEYFFRGNQMPQRPQRESAQGSGVIVSADGYVLTNNHVVDGATEVKVAMSDKREMRARVVGTDAKTDIALLKLDAGSLPFVKLGTSSNVEVGDLALAVGNPFGLGQTVTMGIISAIGRGNLGIEQYEDFIQTDAAINPGNSGGALVDVKGELIGINTAILSGSGGNQGVGFAVPIDMARNVMTQLKEKGSVTRAYLGLYLQDMTPELASGLGSRVTKGALVTEVVAGGPADKAGIRRDDIIVGANGKEVSDMRALQLMTAPQTPGTKFDLRVIRNGSEQQISVTLGTMPAEPLRAGNDDNPFPGRGRRR